MKESIKNITFLTLFFFIPFEVLSQGERNNWYFGMFAGVTFNGNNLSSLSDNNIERQIVFGQIEGPDNIAVANDENGNLLFYTDGRIFRNRLHQNMPNSATDKYAIWESQQVVTRNPGNPNQYYVFVTVRDGTSKRLTYVVVDMSLDNGMGDIILESAHTILLPTAGNQMTTAQHKNGRDIWLICQSSSSFQSFLISPNGISTNPVTSLGGLRFADRFSNDIGSMEISPDNKVLVATFPSLGMVSFLNFNNLTGKLTKFYQDPPAPNQPGEKLQPTEFTSVEFSTNSKVVYVSHMTEGIRQYDLNNINLIPSFFNLTPFVQTGLTFPYIKRGPNGKIYVSNRGTSFLGAINNPNLIGIGCNYQVNAFSFSRGSNLLDLPTFLLPERPEGISFLNICLGETTQLRYGNSTGINTYEWGLGDGTTAIGDTVEHIYSSPGTYTVSVQARNLSGIPTFSDSKDIIIYDTPIASPIENLYYCLEDTTIFFINMNNEILGNLDSSIFAVSYYLNEQDALKRDNNINDYTPIIGTQTIWVRLENKINFQCFDIFNFDIVTPEFFSIDIETEQFLCNDSDLTIRAPNDFINYEWSTGSNAQEITVSNVGTYTLTVIKDFIDFTCESTIEINVDILPLPIIESIKVTDWSIRNNSIEVIMQRSGEYEYSLDNINFQRSNKFTNLPLEDYQVYVRDLICGENVQSKKLYLLYYDKFFTPNGDGFNDFWQIFNSKQETNIRITLYNRYGKLIAVLDPEGIGWDGTYNGVNVPSSDYWFRVERSNGQVHTGHFTLKR